MGRKLKLKIIYYTAAQFLASNPVLEPDQLGIETDSGRIKIGNGYGSWTDLTYLGGDKDPHTVIGTIGFADLNVGDNVTFVDANPEGKALVELIYIVTEDFASDGGTIIVGVGIEALPSLGTEDIGIEGVKLLEPYQGKSKNSAHDIVVGVVLDETNANDWTTGSITVIAVTKDFPLYE